MSRQIVTGTILSHARHTHALSLNRWVNYWVIEWGSEWRAVCKHVSAGTCVNVCASLCNCCLWQKVVEYVLLNWNESEPSSQFKWLHQKAWRRKEKRKKTLVVRKELHTGLKGPYYQVMEPYCLIVQFIFLKQVCCFWSPIPSVTQHD